MATWIAIFLMLFFFCIGSNGNDYMFLLKGHEDLRQDERVMQLFGLVNTLLLNDPDTFRRNLTIQVRTVLVIAGSISYN